MVVVVRRLIKAFGKQVRAPIFYPEGSVLTEDKIKKAKKLDEILKKRVDTINHEFEKLKKQTKVNDLEKWKWLGGKVEEILKSVKSIEDKDVDKNVIWPAVSQYLRKELKRGFDDEKRSGTKNDHLRKCYLLATTPGTDWINSWVGWDAFTDRGDQLVISGKLMPVLNKKFSKIKTRLNSRDYQKIAKIIVDFIPTQAKKPADIDSMSKKKINEIVNQVYEKFYKQKVRRLEND